MKKETTKVEGVQSYVVKAQNFEQKFTSLDKAQETYNKIVDKALKAQKPVIAKLFSKDGSKLTEIESVNIKEDHYDEA
jgi:hypothetical protein